MELDIKPLMPGMDFAVEIKNIDLSQSLDNVIFEEIRQAVFSYAVVVIRGQSINDEQQISFSERFGELEKSLVKIDGEIKFPQIYITTNVGKDDKILPRDHASAKYHRGNSLWHSDSSFKPIPANISILSGREVPPFGGETEFADVRYAYDSWPGSISGVEKCELDDLICEHSITFSRQLIVGDIFSEEDKKSIKPVRQALIRKHPETGRKALYVGSHCHFIEGWEYPRSRALIAELTSWMTRPEFVYAHKWRPLDLVMWDNRSVVHRGNPWPDEDYRRVMHRTTVAGNGPTV